MEENNLIKLTAREWVEKTDEEILEFLQNGTVETQKVGQRSIQAIIVYKGCYRPFSPPREDKQDVIAYAKRQAASIIELIKIELGYA